MRQCDAHGSLQLGCLTAITAVFFLLEFVELEPQRLGCSALSATKGRP